MNTKIVIIGAGASGMMAAIQAARAGADVTILEHMDRVGKKILSTGNGRCNLSNLYQSKDCYRCSQPSFPEKILRQFTVEETMAFFQGLGILFKDRNGYLYPNSDQASSVLDVLRMELAFRKVKLTDHCHVKSIKTLKTEKDSETPSGQRFLIRTDCGDFYGDCLIIATGSKAAPVTGSDGSGYLLASSMGHHIITPLPALVQLRCREKHYKQLAGVRTDVKIQLFADGGFLAEDKGELQLTDYGISGIPVFQVSRYASVALHRKQNVKAVIDFLPQLDEKEAREMLQRRREHMACKEAEQWMTGLLNKKLSLVLLKLSGILAEQTMASVSENNWNRLLHHLKSYETEIVAANPFEQAQVCCGGVDTREISDQTLESRKTPGLYFAGEILDVDGICGGYNLQWAWASGAVAGKSAVARKDRS